MRWRRGRRLMHGSRFAFSFSRRVVLWFFLVLSPAASRAAMVATHGYQFTCFIILKRTARQTNQRKTQQLPEGAVALRGMS